MVDIVEPWLIDIQFLTLSSKENKIEKSKIENSFLKIVTHVHKKLEFVCVIT